MKCSLFVGTLLCSALVVGSAQAAEAFTLKGTDVRPGKMIPEVHVMDQFGCTGGNKSPQLSWQGAPKGAKSFVLTVYDPDAPTGSGFWHWVVYDIPPNVTELPEGIGNGSALPAGAKEGRTDVGKPGYIGPCPPVGDKAHRYVFTVYALKVEKLEVPDDATAALIGFMTHGNQIGKTTFTALYKR